MKDDSTPKETFAPAEPDIDQTVHSVAADVQAAETKELSQRVALLEGLVSLRSH
jgi:hypothetical protein